MTLEESESIEVALVLEAIRAKYGCDLRGYTRESMHRRLRAALEGLRLGHLGELQHALLHDPGLFAQLLDQLTVHVTELFRDPEFYSSFRARVVPLLRTYPLLRIWHAGCATGEEVYALAMLLTEEGLYERCQIYATDLSETALAQAKEGVFSATRVATFADNYLRAGGRGLFSRYYTAAYDHVGMSARLRENILFFPHNLVTDFAFGEMHVVFCRNVFIYFGPELRLQVLSKFQSSLCGGGFLCLGTSERLCNSVRGQFSDFSDEQHIYRHTALAL